MCKASLPTTFRKPLRVPSSTVITLYDHWRWDPQRLPKRRRQTYLTHRAKTPKPKTTTWSNIFETKMYKLVTCRSATTVSSWKRHYEGWNALLHVIGLSLCGTEPSIHLTLRRGFSNGRPPAIRLPRKPRTRINAQIAAMRVFPSKISPIHTHPLVCNVNRTSLTDAVWTNMVVGVLKPHSVCPRVKPAATCSVKHFRGFYCISDIDERGYGQNIPFICVWFADRDRLEVWSHTMNPVIWS